MSIERIRELLTFFWTTHNPPKKNRQTIEELNGNYNLEFLTGKRHDNFQTELIEDPKDLDVDEDVVDPPSTLSEDCVAVSARRSHDVDLTRIATRWRRVARARQLQHCVAAHKLSQSATVIHSARVGAYVSVCGWVAVAIGIYALEIFDYWNVEVVLILKEATTN